MKTFREFQNTDLNEAVVNTHLHDLYDEMNEAIDKFYDKAPQAKKQALLKITNTFATSVEKLFPDELG